MYKKGDPSEPGNHRPISLISIFRKLLEYCLQHFLVGSSPTLDLAQGGFREVRGSLDQTLCLAKICTIPHRHHHITPVLAFLDMKSAYDTVDCRYIWKDLENKSSAPLICLLRNLFDGVQKEVLLNNATLTRFSPVTSVLQGPILLPFLYSIYINDLPKLLRPQPLEEDLSPSHLAPCMTYIL
ncbi:hypothetical protein G6F46_012096 [Rhizopus delemar]|uniref:Reverse transcriptase domain-containing protein n=2 Tax=Rhizopus TaxID=4842 RepID=A0A9P7CRX4_9FUNG|nr:hypothetical protein G6F55_004763 [Rhizopus delemar]KAG1548094.1 hypothetical protein G6F51_003877 [Rhizopus arrhizus]KAG1488338.1 hypothetical protein G6F54_012126 [Rhizopus delemar]KAG1497040.1 hypothetical protein G6F53_012051 [Rhizopus delemar]KAG1526744.1 hypothetical protein G6F52_002162 [Rhizopus delemar]